MYVNIPHEDFEEGMCGEFVRAMYGIKDAPQNGEYKYNSVLVELGFTKGKLHLVYFIMSLEILG